MAVEHGLSDEQFALVSGRSLRFSPAWDCSDARVVFDANSGDFWVLSALAADAVAVLAGQPVASLSAMRDRLSIDAAADPGAGELLAAAVQSLIDAGLLRCLAKVAGH